jgi:hypothetical protein
MLDAQRLDAEISQKYLAMLDAAQSQDHSREKRVLRFLARSSSRVELKEWAELELEVLAVAHEKAQERDAAKKEADSNVKTSGTEAEKARAAVKAASTRLNNIESMKDPDLLRPYIYTETNGVISRLIASKVPGEPNKDRDRFWQLYCGQMIAVESKEVEAAMVQFGNKLNDCESASGGRRGARTPDQ